MRHKLSIILIAFTLFSCKDNFGDKNKRNENWAWWTDAKTGKSKWIPVNGDGYPVTDGKYTRFYFNGNVYDKGKLVDGKDADTIFCYDLNGHLQEYRIPANDTSYFGEVSDRSEFFIKNGPIKIYYPNGQLYSSGIIKNHTYGNEWISHFKNGNLQYVKNFKGDTGWSTRYYYNGKVKDSDYHEGEEAFHIKHWYENGQLEESSEFKSGNFNGLQKEYYPNGKIKAIVNIINGKANGKVMFWFEDGKVNGIGYKKNGLYDGRQIVYYENGKIQLDVNSKNGKGDGECKRYDETGKLIADYILKDGIKVEDKLSTPLIH